MNLAIELSDEDSRAFEAEAHAEGLSVANWLKKVGRERLPPRNGGAGTEEDRESYRPISEVIEEIMSDAPPQELAKLPRDGARQIDHYLYGSPKR